MGVIQAAAAEANSELALVTWVHSCGESALKFCVLSPSRGATCLKDHDRALGNKAVSGSDFGGRDSVVHHRVAYVGVNRRRDRLTWSQHLSFDRHLKIRCD